MADDVVFDAPKKKFTLTYDELKIEGVANFNKLSELYERSITLDYPTGLWLAGQSTVSNRYIMSQYDMDGRKINELDLQKTLELGNSQVFGMSTYDLSNGNALYIKAGILLDGDRNWSANIFLDKKTNRINWKSKSDSGRIPIFSFKNGNILLFTPSRALYTADGSNVIGRIPEKTYIENAKDSVLLPLDIPPWSGMLKLGNTVLLNYGDFIQSVNELGKITNISAKLPSFASAMPGTSGLATSLGGFFCTPSRKKVSQLTTQEGKRTKITRPRSLNMYYYDEGAGKIYNLGNTGEIAPYVEITEGDKEIDQTRYQGDVAVVTETGDYYEVMWDKVGINVYHSAANQAVLKKRLEQAISDDKNFVHLKKKN